MTTETIDEGAQERPDTEETVATTIAAYEPIAAGLAQLRHQIKGVVYDFTTKAGEAVARADRKHCVTLRTRATSIKDDLKRDILARGRTIDAEYKALIGAIQDVEASVDDQIKAVEAAREAEAEKKRQAIAAELAAQRAKIAEALAIPAHRAGARRSAAELREVRTRIAAFDPLAWGDLEVEATDAKARAVLAVSDMLSEQEQHEAEQAELAAARAKWAEEQRADVERRKREAEEQAERERVAAAQRKAEDDQRAEQRRREDEERQRLDAERRERLAREEEELAARRRAIEQQEREAREAATARALQAIAEAFPSSMPLDGLSVDELTALRATVKARQIPPAVLGDLGMKAEAQRVLSLAQIDERVDAIRREEERAAAEARSRLERAAPSLLRACQLVAGVAPRIRAWLAAEEPNALRQVEEAIAEAVDEVPT